MADPRFNEEQIFKAALGRTGQCLPLETLAQMADGSLDEPATRQARQHIETCAHCRTEFDLLNEYQAASAGPDEVASVEWIQSELRRRPLGDEVATPVKATPSLWTKMNRWLHAGTPGRRRQAWTLAATSLLVTVAAGVYLQNGNREQPLSGPRSGETVWRSHQFAAIAPVGDLAEAPAELKWEAVQGAAKYQVRMMEVDRTGIWYSEVSDTRVIVPGDLRRKMAHGRSFLWEVAALNAAGQKIAATNLQIFHIIPTSH